MCRAPTCSDAVRNQDEVDTDCGGVCGSGCSVLQAALVHRYRFDGTGTTITDSVRGANGVLVNAALSGSGSASLAGGSSGQFVDLPNGIVSSLVDASFEAWLTWDGGVGWQKIFDFGTSSAGEGNQSTLGQRFLTMSPKRALLGLVLPEQWRQLCAATVQRPLHAELVREVAVVVAPELLLERHGDATFSRLAAKEAGCGIRNADGSPLGV